MALVIGGIIGIFHLNITSQVIKKAGNDAWLSAIIGGLTVLFLWFISIRLSMYYKDETMVEYLPRIYGRIIGNLLNGIFIFYFIMSISFLGRYFSDLAKLELLPNTPRWAILLLFWALIFSWAQFGIRVIAITMTIILIPTFINTIGFVFIPLENIKLEHLLPFLGEGFGPVLSGAYQSIFFLFWGGLFALYHAGT